MSEMNKPIEWNDCYQISNETSFEISKAYLLYVFDKLIVLFINVLSNATKHHLNDKDRFNN